MEQTLPISSSVKIRQNIAAGLLVLTDIFQLIRLLLPQLFIPFATTPQGATLLSSIVGVVFIVAWCILSSTASNKTTRIASIIILASALVGILLSLISLEYNGQYQFIAVVYFCLPLTKIYAFSILLKGYNNINVADRTWIGFIIAYIIASLFVSLSTYLGIFNTIDGYETQRQYNFLWSITWCIWNMALYILIAVAEFRVAKCAAFAGNYNSEPAPQGAYSPINKYFAATFITIPIVLCLLWIVYSNLESIESIF